MTPKEWAEVGELSCLLSPPAGGVTQLEGWEHVAGNRCSHSMARPPSFLLRAQSPPILGGQRQEKAREARANFSPDPKLLLPTSLTPDTIEHSRVLYF